MAGAGQHGPAHPTGVAGKRLARPGGSLSGAFTARSPRARSAGMEASCASRWANAARRRSTNWRSIGKLRCGLCAVRLRRAHGTAAPGIRADTRLEGRAHERTAVARPHRRTRRSRPWCRPPAVTSRAPQSRTICTLTPACYGPVGDTAGAHRTPSLFSPGAAGKLLHTC